MRNKVIQEEVDNGVYFINDSPSTKNVYVGIVDVDGNNKSTAIMKLDQTQLRGFISHLSDYLDDEPDSN